MDKFLDAEKWWNPSHYASLAQKARSKASLIKDCLNLGVEKISNGQIFTELMGQLGLELQTERAKVEGSKKRVRQRRITNDSWIYAQMYVDYQDQLKAEREARKEDVAFEEVLSTPPDIYTEAPFSGGVTKIQARGRGSR